jgi:transcription initiation factor IIE alpha subunit
MEAEGYDDFHMVDNSKLVPVLMKAVQELSKQVEDQAKRIKELEN